MKNKGLRQYRFSNNPKEENLARMWERVNTINGTGNNLLEYMLAKDSNFPAGEVTDRDREVAATVIQWLGSPCGQAFLRDCGYSKSS